MQDEQIELTPAQATAYWWLRVINEKNTELKVWYYNPQGLEKKFKNIFINFNEDEWHYLYLELAKKIENELVKNEILVQETAKGKHDKINAFLSKILKLKFPDISLSSTMSKDYKITSLLNEVKIGDNSTNEWPLPLLYDKNNILVAEEKRLKKEKNIY